MSARAIALPLASSGLPEADGNKRWGTAFAGVLAFHLVALIIAAQWQGKLVPPQKPEMAIALDLAPMPATGEPTAAPAQAAAAPAQAQPLTPRQPVQETRPQPVVRPDVPVPVTAPHVPVPVRAAVAAAAPTSAPAAASGGSEGASGSVSGATGAASASGDSASRGTPGRAGGGGDEAAAWRGRVLAHLDRHKRFPAMARQMKRVGRVLLRMTLDRRGNVIDVGVDRGAGFPAFDKEALETVRRAAPLPAPPGSLQGTVVPLTVPISFDRPGGA